MSLEQKSKAELLAEANILEQMGGDWTLAQAAAFCNVSVAYLSRSSCPKHRKGMECGVKGKTFVYLKPREVRLWDNARRVREAA